MKTRLYTILCFLLITCASFAQQNKPLATARYEGYITKLDKGITAIDYTDFRHSFLESEYYDSFSSDCFHLKKKLKEATDAKKYPDAIAIAEEMLGIDYTNLYAHKYLQVAYKALGKTASAKTQQAILSGLQNSILKSGDGTTCETGWHVIQDEEIHFILDLLGATEVSRKTVHAGKRYCDKKEVTQGGKAVTYFFEINKQIESMGDISKD
jgi:Domain of unknown function (DUF4919)